MSGWQMKIITAEAQLLMALAAEDADLRADLRALAEAILAATEVPQPHAATTAPSPADDAPSVSPSGAVPVHSVQEGEPHGPTAHGIAQADRAQEAELLRELTLGRSRPSPAEIQYPPRATTRPVVTDADLAEIEARCRLKAEGARWAAARQRRIREGGDFQAEIAPEDPAIVEWADRLADCFYWMNSPDASQPADISLLDDVGGCFESVAEAIALVRDILDDTSSHRGRIEQALPLIAEAQSALRAAVQAIHGPDDPEQLQVFEWLKETASRHHVYIRRFMRADDLANPTLWPDLLARIEEVEAKLRKNQERLQQKGSWINQLHSHLKLIREGKGMDRDWQTVVMSVEEMIREGVPPSNREIRELLLPVIDNLPGRDDLPHGFRLVLREIDRFLATRTPPSGTEINHEPTAEVREARRLLEGRSVVLIGGICRRESQKLLRTALGLKELIWIETKEHQSIGTFEPTIARTDMALVLLAIRWSSHAFGEVKQFCDRHGKPLVRLPGGYSPNQVAAQILSQCSGQLGGG
jgi:hypothetical protein